MDGSSAIGIRVGDCQRLEAGVELGFGCTGDGDSSCSGSADNAASAADGSNRAVADSHRRRDGGRSIVIRVGEDDVGVAGIQQQGRRSLVDRNIVGRDGARVIDRRNEQRTGIASDVEQVVGRHHCGVRVESVGGGHCCQTCLIQSPAISSPDQCSSTVSQTVIGNHLNRIRAVQVADTQIGKGHPQTDQVCIDLGQRTAKLKRSCAARQCGIHGGTVA